ncbi:MAG: hypothetical protein MJZ00_04380 [Paludibacteraceae bacterium]|nr:hypothetical protein [Paludibacteraceae bacterium]
MICRILNILLLTFFFHSALGQETLQEIFSQLKSDTVVDAKKKELSKKVEKIVSDSLKKGKSFAPSFNHSEIGKVLSDDNKVCIYSWAFTLSDKSFHYGSVVQTKLRKGSRVEILNIKKTPFLPQPTERIQRGNWYGALYYKIAHVKYRRDSYYILLGWAGYSAITHYKVIDVLKVDGSGRPSFGKQVFKRKGRQTWSRHVFEYNSQGKIALNYDESAKMIVFDHLVPESTMFTDIYSYYGPDFTYDTYVFREGKWFYNDNVDIRNKE